MTDNDKDIITGKGRCTVRQETYLGTYNNQMEPVTIKNTMPNELYVQLNS